MVKEAKLLPFQVIIVNCQNWQRNREGSPWYYVNTSQKLRHMPGVFVGGGNMIPARFNMIHLLDRGGGRHSSLGASRLDNVGSEPCRKRTNFQVTHSGSDFPAESTDSGTIFRNSHNHNTRWCLYYLDELRQANSSHILSIRPPQRGCAVILLDSHLHPIVNHLHLGVFRLQVRDLKSICID
ncbi:hypothetical protein BD779DRAFT_479005 [Infundibulicybe gibba]|nr:hypothetical protein BD779DRAFT_479005 [Infundibulicybe gibba]